MPKAELGFVEIKNKSLNATLMAYPCMRALMSVVVDAMDLSVGAALLTSGGLDKPNLSHFFSDFDHHQMSIFNF